ncbi:hypothetical protein Q8W71_32040 [Methylobacterium sp. NEAU 140]|uniref:hypothetical protein n=1 Tax=Methylobacterium sp. NEAU 140 TaxID=3064945 RepID=UPI0027354990|nr:hypothetical protein [Methylobacterium sp. NEAU 140]MDP4027206.1 hypothetical protein [Methylobacterium sp. NEAU 140]
MFTSDLVPGGLFLAGIVLSIAADARLRRSAGGCWRTGCLTAAGAALVFCACAVAIR